MTKDVVGKEKDKMYLVSTRGKSKKMLALDAVLQGIADDGGLFVPERFPEIPLNTLLEWGKLPYAECAAKVLSYYFDIDYSELADMTRDAYTSFSDKEVVPIQKIAEGEYVMELFHGPTLAFKDVALQLLPRLMSRALEKSDQDALILTATSGDTGKAALEGFKDVDRTKIAIFYPNDGVSDMQKLQMTTQEGKNVYVGAIRGNFDDAQTTVKKLFTDPAFIESAAQKNMKLSSANSINFGRLAPQIAYYIYSYGRLVAAKEIEAGQKVNFVVPTGNFGNILAAYYAIRMGLPVYRLICASNKNNVLTDFLESGVYMAQREFYKTISPSMDILISSNLERLLYEISGRDPQTVSLYMQDLKEQGNYRVRMSDKQQLDNLFFGDFADEFPTSNTIKRTFEDCGYLMDPHTAVGRCVYGRYKRLMQDDTPTILASTASPFKFPQDVLYAITREKIDDAFIAAEKLARLSGEKIPVQLSKLQNAPVRFTDVLDKEEMGESILENL